MSKRLLRPRPIKTENISSDIILIDESENDSKSECSTVILKKSRYSDIEYISSDDDESPKKKRLKLQSDDKKSTQKTLKGTKIKDEIKPSTSGLQPFSIDNETPKKKKTTLNSKSKNSTKKALKCKTESSINKKQEKRRSIHVDKEDRSKKKRTKLSSKSTNSTKKSSNCKTVLVKSATNSKQIKFELFDEDLLAEKETLSKNIARSMIKLFAEGNSIPFLARYRRHLTGDMTPEKLRRMKESYDEIVELKNKGNLVLNNLYKSEKLTSDLEETILRCRSIQELEHIYAPYKPTNKKSLAERAKILGLEEFAISLLEGDKQVNIDSLIKKNGQEGLQNRHEVEKNLIHIIGHIIAHHSDVLTCLRDLIETLNVKMVTKISSSAKNNIKDPNVSKFDHYFDNQFNAKFIQPHQVLAINRGESSKILTVKVIIPDFVFNKFKYFCEQKWLNNTIKYPDRIRIFHTTLEEIYTKSIIPFLSRKIRAELKTNAHKSGIDFFTKNVKQLLLESPVKGKTIMAIDPGLKVGCKIGIISQYGDVLDTSVIFPHTSKNYMNDAELIKKLLHKHNCTLVGIGNGKSCRETESWLTDLIQKKFFNPLDISYTIVDESGASIYSCSDEAKKEFPDLDPLKISAVSLARRLQDPLAELVKIDPKSLGVGMYQHDLNQKLLDNALNEVISECVSFVGVDLNTASHCLLRRVAGLTSQRAENIIKHRKINGPFTNRYQLKDVKGIGDKVFEQCSGFLRVMPSNSNEAWPFYNRPETTPLDATDIHPESYEIAEKMSEKFGLFYKQIGLPSFINEFTFKVKTVSVQTLAKEYNSSEQTLQLVIDALSKPLAHDLRIENPHGPIFKSNITTIADLRPGLSITGRITNVVAFGAFVDIGVGKSGLIHNSKIKGVEIGIGQRVQVKVLKVENNGARIGLELENILN